MKVVMLDAPESLIEERRQKGLDRYDEMWEGVLHMVPQPEDWHQLFGSELISVLVPLAKARGLRASYETALHRPGPKLDYRVPDILVNKPEHRATGRSEGAELVIEILSPNDESREKLPFYTERGVKEAFLIDPHTRAIEVYLERGGRLLPAIPTQENVYRSSVLDVTLSTITGPKLLVRWAGGETTI